MVLHCPGDLWSHSQQLGRVEGEGELRGMDCSTDGAWCLVCMVCTVFTCASVCCCSFQGSVFGWFRDCWMQTKCAPVSVHHEPHLFGAEILEITVITCNYHRLTWGSFPPAQSLPQSSQSQRFRNTQIHHPPDCLWRRIPMVQRGIWPTRCWTSGGGHWHRNLCGWATSQYVGSQLAEEWLASTKHLQQPRT